MSAMYGPLALAASSVVYEGLPTYPDAGRPWRIAEELDVNIFHTSPTAIRALRRAGPDEPRKYHHRFKHMTTVGEPIEPAVWRWYYDVVGKGEAVIVDYSCEGDVMLAVRNPIAKIPCDPLADLGIDLSPAIPTKDHFRAFQFPKVFLEQRLNFVKYVREFFARPI